METIVFSVEELFPTLGSATEEETEAVLAIVPLPDGAVTVIVIGGAMLPAGRLGRMQVTGAVPLQLQPLPFALTKVTSAGSVSLADSEVASEGPAFPTVIV